MRYRFSGCELDTQLRAICRGDKQLTLRPKPFEMLVYLIENCDRVVSKQEFADQLWPDQYISDAVIQNSILAVRQALGDSGREQRMIQTLHGYGYRFVAPITAVVDAAAVDAGEPKPQEAQLLPVEPNLPTQRSEATSATENDRVPAPTMTHTASSRRQLTVLFCDLVGATHLSSELDPEDYMDIVHGYHETCAAVIKHFEGHIAQYLGDGVLVYFGYPAAHEDDARRAVYTALGILDRIGQFNDQLRSTHGVQISVHMGIHTGLVVVSTMGAGTHETRLALGETPNIAARLQNLAAPNTAILSAATHQLTRGYFEFQALGTQIVRGLAEPMDTYQVLQASDTYNRFTVSMRQGLTPLVGRERELELLLERWSRSRDGSNHIVFMSGEAGIGKSRLVQALKEQTRSETCSMLECQGSPYHQHTAFWPMLALFPHVFQWEPQEPTEIKVSKMEQFLEQIQLPQKEMMPLLIHLLSLPDKGYPPLELTPEQQRLKTFEALLKVIFGLAELHPILLVMEDLHWMDPSTLEFLQLLVDQGPMVPLLTVVTCRPGVQPSWILRSRVTPMPLDRLEPEHVREMITLVLGDHKLSVAVQQQIMTRTDGIPLFVEEVTKMLREGSSHPAWERDRAGGDITPVLPIPATLKDLLMARLDQMGASKEIAQVGSIIGRSFDYGLIHELTTWDEIALGAGLRELVRAELMYQQGVPPQASYMFKHAMIQDAAYNSLLVRWRKELHHKVGTAIETRHSDCLVEYDVELAHHFTQAEKWTKAMRYSTMAGDRAAKAFANVEAKAHYERALSAAEQLHLSMSDSDLVEHLYANYAAILEWLGEYENAVAAYQQSLTIIKRMGNPRREIDILLGLSGVYNSMHDEEPATSYSEQALTLARTIDDRACLATCLVRRAAIRSVAYGQLIETTAEAEEARQLAQAMHEPHALAHTLLFLGGVLQWRAMFDQSFACLQEGLELAQRLHEGRMIGHASFFLGNGYAARGSYEEALQWYQQLRDYTSTAGDTFWFPRIPIGIGGVHLELFDVEEALRLSLEGAETAKQFYAWPEPRGHSLVQAGLSYLYQDEHGRAEACLREAETLLEDDAWMRWRWHIVLLRAFGELALAEGRYDDAWTYTTQSLELARQSDSRKHVARVQLLQGRLLAIRGQFVDAEQVLASTVCLADAIQIPRDVWMGKAELAKVLMRLGREREAEKQLNQALQTIEAMIAQLHQPRLRRSFLQALPTLEIYNVLGQRPPSATH